jgi:hypothetical protein
MTQPPEIEAHCQWNLNTAASADSGLACLRMSDGKIFMFGVHLRVRCKRQPLVVVVIFLAVPTVRRPKALAASQAHQVCVIGTTKVIFERERPEIEQAICISRANRPALRPAGQRVMPEAVNPAPTITSVVGWPTPIIAGPS